MAGNIVAQLAITLDEGGQVSLNGPLENRMVCYGLLEMAKEALANHAREAAKRVQLAPPGMHVVPPVKGS